MGFGGFRVGEHVEVLGGGGARECFPHTLSIWLFICILYYIFYNKSVNVSLSSVGHSNKILNPRKGLWEP